MENTVVSKCQFFRRGVFFVPSNINLCNYKKRLDYAVRSSSIRYHRKTTGEEAAGAIRERNASGAGV